jgi:nucleoside-diphosphate-sugar epimerase
MHFFGYRVIPPYLTYHVADAAGALVRSVEIPVKAATMIHDFALTARHAIFMDLPVVFDMPTAMAGSTMPFHWSESYGARLGVLPRGGAESVRWVGYLSTIGVYGDAGGAWIDEDTPARPGSARASRRIEAEAAWLDFGKRTGKRVQIFRLGGIYGPGRSAFDDLRAGSARRIIKPGQVFNRIHVGDIANVLVAAVGGRGRHSIYNVVDDEPGPPQDVVAYAAGLLGVPAPPEIPFEKAELSPMGRSFYSENRRVRNARLKEDLGVRLAYPSYREGLAAIRDAERESTPSR